jgi:hypothetical protein
VFHPDVAFVSSGCCIVTMAIHVCCKCMFHLFQTYVASVYLDVAYVAVAIYICCKCSHVSDDVA